MFSKVKKDLGFDNLYDVFCLKNFNKVLTQEGINHYNEILGGKSLENGTKITRSE